MSKNQIFGPQNGPAPDFLRNTYDKTFQNLITTDFGELRPCFCKEVLPGDSIRIDPVAAVRSHPIVFPINTRIKFYCYFFYGRNRIFYKQFEDFIWGTKDGLVPPLLRLSNERAKKMISTGSLGDNLGVPTTVGLDAPVQDSVSVTYGYFARFNNINWSSSLGSRSLEKINNLYIANLRSASFTLNSGQFSPSLCIGVGFLTGLFHTLIHPELKFDVFSSYNRDFRMSNVIVAAVDSANHFISPFFEMKNFTYEKENSTFHCTYVLPMSDLEPYIIPSLGYKLLVLSYKDDESYNIVDNSPLFPINPTSADLVPSTVFSTVAEAGVFDATDPIFIDQNKFVGDNPRIPLSALPFRMYEFCCNYFFRNDQNNPYILNGEPQYNQFIPTTDGGWDTNEYLIHHRNWEMDAYTSAVPSPQYGTAPLVGLTYSGGDTATVQVDVTDSDGQSRKLGIQVGVNVDGTINSILHADEGVPSGSLRRLMDGTDGIKLGMSINDFRNVNAFQRFKENVLRRGLRYRNQLLSHMGVSVDYPDIDIPQFIGGFSGDLTVREVTNMAESAEVALGDVAGKIDAVLTSNHSISCYCPEHGFIMGIFSIVPVPTYSQLLPRMFTRYNYLDYFQQEFAKIGYVPITHREFLPLQSKEPDTVLGYQRAFYEYMFSTDEVHGDFRTTLSDFVLYRQFKEVPTLNEDFVTVKSDSLNNIFAVDKVQEKYKNSAKFMCSFFFDVSHKMQIPKFGTPSLE